MTRLLFVVCLVVSFVLGYYASSFTSLSSSHEKTFALLQENQTHNKKLISSSDEILILVQKLPSIRDVDENDVDGDYFDENHIYEFEDTLP